MTKLSPQSSCLLLNGRKQTVSHWFQVQHPASGVCDASAQERQAVLPDIRGPQRRQDGRGRLCLQHLHGASQQRSEDVRMVLSSFVALCLFTALENQIQESFRRSSPRSGACSGRHGGRASHPEPPQTVILWCRPAHHDHAALLPPHQALHGRTYANQWGIYKHVTHFNTHLWAIQQKPTGVVLLQRQKLIQSSKNQRDGEAGPGSTTNSLKRSGSCSLENGGKATGAGVAEPGDKPGAGGGQPEEEEDDEDGIFSPVRIPGEEDWALLSWILFI